MIIVMNINSFAVRLTVENEAAVAEVGQQSEDGGVEPHEADDLARPPLGRQFAGPQRRERDHHISTYTEDFSWLVFHFMFQKL